MARPKLCRQSCAAGAEPKEAALSSPRPAGAPTPIVLAAGLYFEFAYIIIDRGQGLGEYRGERQKCRIAGSGNAKIGFFGQISLGLGGGLREQKGADRQCRSLELMDEIAQNSLWLGRCLVLHECAHSRNQVRRLMLKEFEKLAL